MASREKLQNELCEILGSNNVYFEPPENLKIKYPCIIYGINNIINTHANNKVYLQNRSYTVTVIDYDPESEIADKISRLPLCRHNRTFDSDGLNHSVFTLYY